MSFYALIDSERISLSCTIPVSLPLAKRTISAMRNIFLILFLLPHFLLAQPISLQPEKPGLDETVTLTYFADRGNGELMNYAGDIYAYTGLITNESTQPGDWKQVVSGWGENRPELKLKRVEANRYQLRFTLQDLYGIQRMEDIFALAFVFRNEDGSKVCKSKEGHDIFHYFKEPEFMTPPEILDVSEVKQPDWAKTATIYEVNIRQYTPEGTFEAFEKHLPRLQELGVDILWFMPIQPIGKKKRKGTLGSYYSIQAYTDVNPEFGKLEEFKELVKKCHEMGFHVVLDWVANHTAWDHPWIKKHPDWYTRDEKGRIVYPADWTDVADLNYENADMRKAMIEAMRFWLREADIDGFRCDVAGLVPLNFWEAARSELDKEKEIWMIAEDESQYFLLNRAFNANYASSFHHVMNDIAEGKKKASDVLAWYEVKEGLYPEGAYPMHFTTNHDENSWNGTVFERLGDSYKTFALLTYLMPGMPLIYSGQEAGLDKRLSFFEKDTINWSDKSLSSFYQTLNQLKAENPALWNGSAGGDLIKIQNDQADHALTFARRKGGNKVILIANLSPEKRTIMTQMDEVQGRYQEVFSGKIQDLKSRVTFELPPWGYELWVMKSRG
jgi:glycosidase